MVNSKFLHRYVGSHHISEMIHVVRTRVLVRPAPEESRPLLVERGIAASTIRASVLVCRLPPAAPRRKKTRFLLLSRTIEKEGGGR